jgi:hypothetical protein
LFGTESVPGRDAAPQRVRANPGTEATRAIHMVGSLRLDSGLGGHLLIQRCAFYQACLVPTCCRFATAWSRAADLLRTWALLDEGRCACDLLRSAKSSTTKP